MVAVAASLASWSVCTAESARSETLRRIVVILLVIALKRGTDLLSGRTGSSAASVERRLCDVVLRATPVGRQTGRCARETAGRITGRSRWIGDWRFAAKPPTAAAIASRATSSPATAIGSAVGHRPAAVRRTNCHGRRAARDGPPTGEVRCRCQHCCSQHVVLMMVLWDRDLVVDGSGACSNREAAKNSRLRKKARLGAFGQFCTSNGPAQARHDWGSRVIHRGAAADHCVLDP